MSNILCKKCGNIKKPGRCKACTRIRVKQWRIDNRDKFIEQRRKWRKANPDKVKLYSKRWYDAHPGVSTQKSREWRNKNRDKFTKRNRDYQRNRRRNDLEYRLACNLRRRLQQAVARNTKTGSAVRDLGCSIIELKQYLQLKFYNHPISNIPMTWDNYGRFGWHIDHIKPLTCFDLTNRRQLLQACHFTNLRSLWWYENLSKGGKYND